VRTTPIAAGRTLPDLIPREANGILGSPIVNVRLVSREAGC